MQHLRIVVLMFSVGVMILGSGAVLSQDYPNRPIRFITAGVGGSGDLDARSVAQGISGPLGQPVIVENRATGILSADFVAKAPPDGYTLQVAGGAVWISTLLQKTTYDPIRDFAPITLIERTVNIVVVHPSLPAKSVKELIAIAKARPGELNFGSSAVGGASHLAGELFKALARINIVHIPYKGNAATVTALLNGEIQLNFSSAGTAAPYTKSGRLRALAVTSAQPSPLAPGLPSVAASGLPGYEAVAMTGMFAPVKTPVEIINRLNQEIVRFLKRTDVKEQYLNRGVEAVGSSPEEFGAAVKSEIVSTAKVIKDAGIRVE